MNIDDDSNRSVPCESPQCDNLIFEEEAEEGTSSPGPQSQQKSLSMKSSVRSPSPTLIYPLQKSESMPMQITSISDGNNLSPGRMGNGNGSTNTNDPGQGIVKGLQFVN